MGKLALVLMAFVSNVEVSPKTATLKVGESFQLSGEITPVWASANPKVASVTQDGTVTALAPGTAKITERVGSASGASTIVVVANAAKALGYHGPYIDVWGPGLNDFVDDPTGSGRGKVYRQYYAPTESNKSADVYLAYGQVVNPLRYGHTIWMKGDFYLPSTAVSGIRKATDNRKLIDFGSGGGGARLVIHRRQSDFTPDKNVLKFSANDVMGTGVVAETAYGETGIEILDDRWYTVKLRATMNTADNVRDGSISISIDGVTRFSHNGFGWITESWPGGSCFNTFRFGSQLSVQSPLYSEYRYWANVGFYDEDPD